MISAHSDESKQVDHTKVRVVPIMTKRCPYCSNILALSEKTCHGCKNKVGDPDPEGVAKIPGKWKAYIWFVLAFGLAVGYFYFAFFME